jgi:hypothetical protein
MTYPRKYATATAAGDHLKDLDWDSIVDAANGMTTSGVTVQQPYSYIFRINGGFYESLTDHGLVAYGGSGNVGGASGASASAVLQATIDAVEAQTSEGTQIGGLIKVQVGYYKGIQDLLIDENGVSLIGESKEVYFEGVAGETALFLSGDTVNAPLRKTIIANLSLVGGGVGIDAKYLHFDNYIHDIYCNGCTDAGIILRGGSWANTFERVTILGSTLGGSGTDYGIRCIGDDENNSVNGNLFIGCCIGRVTYCLTLQGSTNTVFSNYLYASTDGYACAITGDNSNGNVISCNHIETTKVGIYINSFGLYTGSANIITQNFMNGGVDGEIGIQNVIGDNNVFSQNQFYVWATASIQIDAGLHNTIDNNKYYPLAGQVIDNGEATITDVPEYFIKNLPTNGGWTSEVTNSGSTTQTPAELTLLTGVTASSTTLLRSLVYNTVAGPSTGSVAWVNGLWLKFLVARYSSDTQENGAVQLKATSTSGNLTGKGIGIQIANNVLTGEAYGSARQTTGTLVTMDVANGRGYEIWIQVKSTGVNFYVDGALIATLTGTAIPTTTSTDNYLLVSNNNGVTGGTNASLFVSDIVLKTVVS